MSVEVLAAGHVVAGRYRLVKRLGEGGMGTVWLADHVTLRSQVALKLLHGTVQASDDGIKRFLREAQAAAQLRSPHVVQILEHGVDGSVPFIAMELLEGESLATRLARLSTLSLGQTARIVTHVARAIGKAHDAGIVHRDLKPDNIFIVHNDDEEIVKVLDFGVAKMEQVTAEDAAKISTQAGALLGTPHYMSPEQVRGHGVDWRSDLWALAVIAFECVCGRLPFEGKTVGDILVHICSEPLPVPSTLRPLPAGFDEWFAKATSRDPEKRFQSAKEMAEALRGLVGEESRTPLPRYSDTERRLADDAKTLDARGSVRDLERARTVSASGTMGGSSSAVRTQGTGRPMRVAGIALALAASAGIAWFALGRSRSAPTVATDVRRPSAAATSASVPATVETPALSSSVSNAASAQVPPASSASAPAAATAHAHPHAPRTPRVKTAAPAQSAQSDELTF